MMNSLLEDIFDHWTKEIKNNNELDIHITDGYCTQRITGNIYVKKQIVIEDTFDIPYLIIMKYENLIRFLAYKNDFWNSIRMRPDKLNEYYTNFIIFLEDIFDVSLIDFYVN